MASPHDIFTLYKSLTNKYVSIEFKLDESTRDGLLYSIDGLLYSIDPYSGTTTLLQKDNESKFKVSLHFAETINKIKANSADEGDDWVTEIRTHAEDIVNTSMEELASNAEMVARRKTLVVGMQKFRIPVAVEGSQVLVFDGNVVISPPYNAGDCVSANEIMLTKIRQLVREFWRKV